MVDAATGYFVEKELRNFRQQSVAVVIILMTRPLGPDVGDLHDVATALRRHWKVGDRGCEKGVVMIVVGRYD